jgi:hypothetical protein
MSFDVPELERLIASQVCQVTAVILVVGLLPPSYSY